MGVWEDVIAQARGGPPRIIGKAPPPLIPQSTPQGRLYPPGTTPPIPNAQPPGSGVPGTSLAASARAQAEKDIQVLYDQLAAARTQASQAAAPYNQLADSAKGLEAQVGDAYQQAAGRSAAYSQGFSQAFNDTIGSLQDEYNKKMGLAGSSNTPVTKGLGDAIGFLSGGLQSAQTEMARAGQVGAAKLLPDILRSQGLGAVQTARREAESEFSKRFAATQKAGTTAVGTAAYRDAQLALQKERIDAERERAGEIAAKIDSSVSKTLGYAAHADGTPVLTVDGKTIPVQNTSSKKIDLKLSQSLGYYAHPDGSPALTPDGKAMPFSDRTPRKIDSAVSKLLGYVSTSDGTPILRGGKIDPVKKYGSGGGGSGSSSGGSGAVVEFTNGMTGVKNGKISVSVSNNAGDGWARTSTGDLALDSNGKPRKWRVKTKKTAAKRDNFYGLTPSQFYKVRAEANTFAEIAINGDVDPDTGEKIPPLTFEEAVKKANTYFAWPPGYAEAVLLPVYQAEAARIASEQSAADAEARRRLVPSLPVGAAGPPVSVPVPGLLGRTG